jgi:hypothetical protein
MQLTLRKRVLRTNRVTAAIVVAALAVTGATLAFAGNNPQPDSGSPHGAGITHAQYPNGYMLNGVFAPTFNSYTDNKDGSSNDERPFLVGWANNGNEANAVTAAPGDTVTVRAFIHNDGGTSGNVGGIGPSVAKNSRVLMSFPTDKTGTSLHISSYIYADNAVVNENKPGLKTISDDLEIKSNNGAPIKLTYIAGSAQFLQSNKARGQNGYQSYTLTGNQQQYLFTGTRKQEGNNIEITPTSGLGLGSDGSYKSAKAVATSQNDILDWFGCEEYQGYVLFKVKVENVPVIQQSPSPSPSPSVTPTPSMTPTPTSSVTPTPSMTPTPSNTPTPSMTPSPPTTPTPSVTPTPTPTPEICVTPTPGMESPTPTPEECVSPTPTPEICITPTPGSSPSPSMTPTPEICVSPSSPGTPPSNFNKSGGTPPASELPKTGAAEAAMVSALALAISGYLFIRERRQLKQELGKSKVKR